LKKPTFGYLVLFYNFNWERRHLACK